MRITFNKLHLILKQVVSNVVSVLRNGGGLGMDESDVSFMLPNSVLHQSFVSTDVNFIAFAWNFVYHAIVFSQVKSVFGRTSCDLRVVSDLKQRVRLVVVNAQRRGCSDRPLT